MAVSASGFEYIVANVGVAAPVSAYVPESILGNVGVELTEKSDVPEYVIGNVDTSVPTPLIFGLTPSAARSGDGVTVIGSGFGATAGELAGVIEVDHDGAWEALSVVTWTRHSATADAGTVDREISIAGVVDPQHEEVLVTIPVWATPPGLDLRVRTNA